MAGQPTKYNADMQATAESYITSHADYGDVVPTICGLAGVLGVIEKTLYNWSEKHPRFLHTLQTIKQKQKNLLVNKGLDGSFQPTIAKLMLANHGLHDKQDTRHTTLDQDGNETGIKIEWD